MATREQKIEYQRRYRERHPEKIREFKRRYVEKNRAELAARRRNRRAADREKIVAAHKEWADKNPELVAMARVRKRLKELAVRHDYELQYHYRVTLDEYNRILTAQGGVCAICLKLEITSRSPRLVVDHCHTTGRVRALLCHRCNCGLGYFKDNIGRIKRAVAYLEGFDGQGGDQWESRVRSVLESLPPEGGEEGRGKGVANDDRFTEVCRA